MDRRGRVEIIVGGMFSGKTEELIRRIRRARMARQSVMVFKPSIDNRYSESEVASHDQSRIPCFSIKEATDVWDYVTTDTEVVGIDEIQFFDVDVVDIVERLAKKGIRVITAGLDLDWRGKPFHPVPAMMAVAEDVLKLSAVCVVCGAPATRTQKVTSAAPISDEQVEVGSHTLYEARCRDHFLPAIEAPTQAFREQIMQDSVLRQQRFDV